MTQDFGKALDYEKGLEWYLKALGLGNAAAMVTIWAYGEKIHSYAQIFA